MDSDDELSPFPTEPSPHLRKLKRLRKSIPKPPLSDDDDDDDPLFSSSVDFAKLESLEKDPSQTLALHDDDDSNSTGDLILSQESLSLGIDDDLLENVGVDDVEEVKKTRRVLEFGDDDDDDDDGVDGGEEGERVGFGIERREVLKEKVDEEDLFEEGNEKKKKKTETKKTKRVVEGEGGGEAKEKARGSNKRREEKERKSYLKELHVESQRLLRESSNAAFKPIPMVQKPISSVLEKIRKRKLEISRKTIMVNDSSYEVKHNCSDRTMDLDVSNEDDREDSLLIPVEKKIDATSPSGENSLDASNLNFSKDARKQNGPESERSPKSFTEEPTPAFRAPVDDTQDLFDDSEPHDAVVHQQVEQINPLEEDFATSLRSMNLKFDSAPVDDSSSDEEDYDKENIDPHVRETANVSSSPGGDPVKDFVDDEAEEEDDSDDDLNHTQDNEEDDDNEDIEELNDMIATEYEERPVDNERRNELHQKWLEQQDAAGTDNLLQKLKCGSELKDTFMPDKEPEMEENDEEYDDDDSEGAEPRNSMRVNTRKAKEIILQLYKDEEDVYLSDDDEDAHRRRAQSLLIRKEEQATLVSPADDENSREVFGLIKKLNIASETKKRPKTSSFFESVLQQRGNSNSSSKSSFVGRAANHPISSSHKQGSGTFRSFIFGRDDSNSRSSISISEDSSDIVPHETRPSKNFTAKFRNSQTKWSCQTRGHASTETVSRTSLLEILKRSSSQSQACKQGNTVDLTKSIFSFRAPKKPMKIDGRS